MNDKERVLDFILRSPIAVSRRAICEKFGFAPATVGRYLDELQNTGEIEKFGMGRATVYAGDAADVYAYSQSKIPDRKKIAYDFDRVRHHPVEGHSYFNTDQRSEILHCSAIPSTLTHPDYIDAIKRRLLIEASWSSSVLEGNTYSLLDTEELFDRNAEMPGARIEETRMLLNHKHAIEYILSNINSITISKMDIMNVHALLSDGLLKDPSNSGKLRSTPVGIGQSVYQPLDVSFQINEEFKAIVAIAKEIIDPFDQSMYLFLNIAYLQPFVDVNKRTSRMLSNIPLLKAGLLPMSFFQMSRQGFEKGLIHYYETGDVRRMVKEYVNSYKISAARFHDILVNKPTQKELALRLKFRKEIVAAVKSVVRDGTTIGEHVPAVATDEEKLFLLDYIEKCVSGISESNSILYGLSAEDIKNHQAESGAGRFERPKA